uniref:TM2 domain-containing protein n=1 Tax=Macrostomum lignano TaxID=282301 RepID=A0A1I8FF54_9PLAT
MASRTIAYILLFTLGLLGAHQFYLGRSLHGFVMLCSLGGFFAGWLHDLFNLERYIRESEDQFLTEEYQADLSRFTSVPADPAVSACAPANRRRRTAAGCATTYEALKRRLAGSIFFRDKLRDKAPRCSWSRYFGEILFGLTCAMLWLARLPNRMLATSGSSNVLHEAGHLLVLLISLSTQLTSTTSFTAHCSLSPLANWFCRDWRSRQPKPSRAGGRALRACPQQRPRVTYEGESVPLREAVRNFFKSPLWRGDARHDNCIKEGRRPGRDSVPLPQAEGGAAHPDRQQDPDKKAEFQAKFQDVSAACDILLGRKPGQPEGDVMRLSGFVTVCAAPSSAYFAACGTSRADSNPGPHNIHDWGRTTRDSAALRRTRTRNPALKVRVKQERCREEAKLSFRTAHGELARPPPPGAPACNIGLPQSAWARNQQLRVDLDAVELACGVGVGAAPSTPCLPPGTTPSWSTCSDRLLLLPGGAAEGLTLPIRICPAEFVPLPLAT